MNSEELMEVITLDDSGGNTEHFDGSVDVIKDKIETIEDEIETIDDEVETIEDEIKVIKSNDEEVVDVPNLSIVNETVVNFDATLPPGVAPQGFVVVDEEITKSPSKPEAVPIFRLAFRDEEAFQKYQQKIEDFFKELLDKNYDEVKTESSAENLMMEIFDCDDNTDCLPVEGPVERPPIDLYFTLDSEPNKAKKFDVPAYGKRFSRTLKKGEDNTDIEKNENSAPKMTCFNCLGNHSMRDCPEPRNFNEIAKNRKDYYNVRRAPSSARYHLDEDQKFGHLVPGQISAKLRKALGIKDNELPRHIYRMRMLGYPPGWLEEARLQHSGLSLFDSNGLADNGSDEEGEIINPGDKDQYDIKKIIDFPGFNVPPKEGTNDEYIQYWGSVDQLNCSKEVMEAMLSHKKADDGYKRKKFPNPANSKPTDVVNPGEMEIDTVEETTVECVPVKDLFIPPLPKETDSNEPLPPPPPPEDNQLQEDNSNCASNALSSTEGSPTLFDLECAKKQLLAELNESSPQSHPLPEKNGESTADSSIADADLDSSKTEASKSELSLNASSINCETPKNSPKPGSEHKSVKSVHMGTPILQSCSPFRRLPSSEKFSKDICDVINFENLPDATGKYDQMSELLHKVRRTLTDLHKE